MNARKSRQSGMTLVEVLLALGIAGALLAVVFAGQNSIRSRAQFIDTMDQIKETVLSTKSAASSGVAPAGLTGSNTKQLIGRVITFDTTAPKQLTTAALLCVVPATATDQTCAPDSDLETQVPNTIDIPWQAAYQGEAGAAAPATISFVFMRSPLTGTFTGYRYDGVITPILKLSALTPTTTATTLNFTSLSGQQGSLTVNPSLGTVTRSIAP